ncbi:glycosyltransferase family 25 protein [Stipitochalara longipes BDJ]|nr:glycosyltransferase family 25 protein [Stipitochalara longipes BDJ]
MIQARSFPFGSVFLASLLLLFFLCSPKLHLFGQYPFQVIKSYSQHPLADRIGNNTLGFERVFAIGLPERSDKRDALALTSSLTEFKIDWIDGVKGQTIPDKALPFGVDRLKLWKTNLGSWRGHINTVRKVVEEGISSALIMEDDTDWDIRLKSQLKLVARGAHYLYPSTKISQSTEGSPYGDDWDVLWLGHCGEVFPKQLEENASKPPADPDLVSISRKYTIYPDPTVPPPERTRGFQNFSAYPYTRWVHPTGGPICSFAYALSQQGARKVLFDLSVDHLTGPFDNALAGRCRWGRAEERLGIKCLSVTPPLFSHHRVKGVVSGDSDIQSIGGEDLREIGFTENIVWSARQNIRGIIISD